MEAKIKLTKTMLDKSIIDANKTVQRYLDKHWSKGYDEMQPQGGVVFYAVRFADSELETQVRFYKTKRGDKRLSIKNLKKYADVGDTIRIKYEGAYEGHVVTKEEADAAA